MTTAATPTITDTRFNKLKAKLRELFELDKSELDFGIYRIMAAKNKEVTDFLDRQLKDVVRQTLTEHGAGAADALQAELDEMIAGLRKAKLSDEQIEASDGVKDLREKLAAAGGKTGEELEADIYNHLLAFFGRYYDEGDFISQRRYKGDAYAIPYSGEEVTLHWANKDQYYIKSGEWHKDYRFKLPDGRRVRFALTDATQETGNNKEPDEAKRRYILVEDNPVVAEGDTLTFRMHFKAPSEAEKERAADGAVAIFGGDYAKDKSPKKGDERTQFCADAEQRAIEHIPAEWKDAVTSEAATGDKPERTLLGKHLDAFTARNTFDYFIHKDLGGFLRRELDFYIKNEVVRLDDLDAAPAEHLQRVQGRVRAIRRVASKVIELLESLEKFQKKLWLKKKFVLGTSWLVTVDRVPERLRDTVAQNTEQWAEWERLGFKPEGDVGGLFGGAEWGTRAYLDACDKLVVDTRLFDEVFTAEVLAAEAVLGDDDSLNRAETGHLINCDNYQGLNSVMATVNETVDCVYIDPPYNTDVSSIPYKNNYRHAAFATMMRDRIALLRSALSQRGVILVSIDDTERTTLEHALDDAFGHSNRVNELIWSQNTNDGRSPTYSTNHEYVEVYARSKPVVEADPSIFREPKPGFSEVSELVHSFDAKYPSIAQVEAALRDLYRSRKRDYRKAIEKAGLDWETEKRNDPWKGIYQYKFAEYRDAGGRLVSEDRARATDAKIWVYRESDWTIMSSENKQSASTRDPKDPNYRFYEVTHPATGKTCAQPSRGWKGTRFVDPNYPDRNSFESLVADDRIAFGPDESKVPQQKRFLHEVSTNVPKTIVVDYADGEKQTVALFGRSGVFLAPKHSSFLKTLIRPCASSRSVIMDCFGGSGSTAQAVIEMNREDQGTRQFILMEANAYYDTLIRPRIAKLLYSPNWKAGKATAHDQGVSALVKCFAVESYEDALNNLPTPTGDMFDGRPTEEADALIRYALDLEMGPHLLDLDIFRDPWGHAINAQLAGDDEIKRHRVDLVETFNYLLGLRVSAYGPIERYSAEFERAEHDDGLGRLKLTGRLRRDPDGPFKFQRVEGILNDGNDTRALVVWRTLTDDPEQEAAVLDAWMARHREATTERTEHRDYHQIYINGPVTLPQPTAEIRTVYPIEEAFKRKMFEDTEGVS
ncbi:MAG: DNA methyltransferase [Planctomycetota bacterium]